MKTELLEWLNAQLSKAENALAAREQARETWRGGSSQSWKLAGCRLNKSQRLRVAEKEDRISIKCRRDVEMFKVVIAIVSDQSSTHPAT